MAKKKKKNSRKPHPKHLKQKQQIQRKKLQNKKARSKKIAKKKSHAPKVQYQPVKPQKIWAFLAAIVIITFFAYSPSLKNEFTNWDDNSYVLENEVIKEINTKNIKAIFSSPEYRFHMGNYHPLTMISLAIDYQLSKKFSSDTPPPQQIIGENDPPPEVTPYIFHLRNIIFHLINTILVFWVIFLLFPNFKPDTRFWVAIITALLFGVNTIHVESVTWISERKDVLYTMFYLFSLLAYIKYLKKKKFTFFILSLFLFLLSGLSKGQAVSLAPTLIIVDWLYKRKLLNRKVILEKIPYFAIGLVFGIIAIYAQEEGEAIHAMDEYAFYYRILFAAYGSTMYFLKMLFPHDLAAIYPYPHGGVPVKFWFYLIPLALYIFVFVWTLKKAKNYAFAIAFFFLNIALVLQFIPVGSAIMADRYAYIPSIGFFLIIALLMKWVFEKRHKIWPVALAGMIAYSGFLSFLTYQQTKVWKDSITLWDNTLEISPTAIVAWNNRGSAKDKLDMKAEAIKDFTRAIQLKPDYSHAYYNRGTAKKDLGMEKKDSAMLKSAIHDFDIALRYKKEFAEAYHNRGIVKDQLGMQKEAIQDFNKGIAINPSIYGLYSSRGVAKGKLGKLEEAIQDFNKSIQINPNNAEAYSNRGFAKVQLGQIKQGIKDYNIAIKIEPNSADALYNRAIALTKDGQYQAALADYNKVIEIKPGFGMAYYNRALLNLQNLNNKQAACVDFQLALQNNVAYAQHQLNKYCQGNNQTNTNQETTKTGIKK